MPFIINGIAIKDKFDYINKGSRERINTTMREDLKKDIFNLSGYYNIPLSVMLDVWCLMLQENEVLLNEFINNCKKY